MLPLGSTHSVSTEKFISTSLRSMVLSVDLSRVATGTKTSAHLSRDTTPDSKTRLRGDPVYRGTLPSTEWQTFYS